MHRKVREIALLTLPVVAIALVVPGARWLADEGEANKVPRIESFELRAPTPLERFMGADAGFRARLVAPETKDSDRFMDLRMQIRNEAGQMWNSQGKNWAQITRKSRMNFPVEGSSKSWDVESGLDWKTVVGAGKTVSVNVVFEEQDSATAQVFSRASRAFVLTNHLPIAPPPDRTDFVIERVDVVSQVSQRGIENEYEHKFTITTRSAATAGASAKASRTFGSWTMDWYLQPQAGQKAVRLDFVSLGDLANPDAARGNATQSELLLLEYAPALRGRRCLVSGVLSIDQGWPQRIDIELP